MNGAFARKLFGSGNGRRIKSCQPRLDAINAFEAEVATFPDDTLRARTTTFKRQLEAAKSPLSRTTFQ